MRPARRVRFVGADDRVGDGLAVVVDGHDRPSPTREPATGASTMTAERKPRLDRLDPPLEERLLLARGVVLGVLLEVAVLLGRPDAGDDLRALDQGQLVELGAQPRLAVRGQRFRPRRAGRGGAATAVGRRTRRLRRARSARRCRRRRFGSGGSPWAPSASPSATCTTHVGGGGGSTGSGMQRAGQPGRLALAGRAAEVRPRQDDSRGRAAPARSASGTPAANAASSASSYSSVASVAAHQTRTPSSERSVLSQCPPAFGRRSPSSVLADRRHPPRDRRVRGADVQDGLRRAARTRRGARPGPSTSAARRRAAVRRPARSTCRRGSARSARWPAERAVRRRTPPVPAPGPAVPRPLARRP